MPAGERYDSPANAAQHANRMGWAFRFQPAKKGQNPGLNGWQLSGATVRLRNDRLGWTTDARRLVVSGELCRKWLGANFPGEGPADSAGDHESPHGPILGGGHCHGGHHGRHGFVGVLAA